MRYERDPLYMGPTDPGTLYTFPRARNRVYTEHIG